MRAGIGRVRRCWYHRQGRGGNACIQTAKLYNATVITTVGSDEKIEKARALGADLVINSTKEDLIESSEAVHAGALADIAVDHVGADSFRQVPRRGEARRPGRDLRRHGEMQRRSRSGSLPARTSPSTGLRGPRRRSTSNLPLFPRSSGPWWTRLYDFAGRAEGLRELLSRRFFARSWSGMTAAEHRAAPGQAILPGPTRPCT